MEQADIQDVLKIQIATRNAKMGLKEATRLVAQNGAELVIMASDVNSAEYKSLIDAIARESKTPLINVDSKEILGTWCGLSKTDEEGEVTKARPCGVVALKTIPNSAAGEKLKQFIQSNQA